MKLKTKLIIIIIQIVLVFILFNNKHIQISYYDIYSEKITSEITIVQISDLHNTSFGKNNIHLVSRIRKIKPDVITITGDLIDANNTKLDVALNFIEDIVEIAPVYYVTGNHESWVIEDYNYLRREMEKRGVIVLDNRAIETAFYDTNITIIGIDDYNLINLKTELDNLSYDRNSFSLLLSHRPELFEDYQNRDIDLVLTGHAHGGQIIIPFVGGLIAPDQGMLPKYFAGIFESKDGTKMIVSRGLGNSIIPIRINNYPELVVINLKSSKSI